MSDFSGNTGMSFDGLSFAELHQQPLPLVVANIWDAASAAICQRLISPNGQANSRNAQTDVAPVALATSSASLAWSLGFADGEQLPVAELLGAIQRIQRVITLPLSVDIEMGYSGDVRRVAELACRLRELGVVGINIEDGDQPVALLCEKVAAIKAQLGEDVFVNARTDVFLRGLVPEAERLAETVRRGECYRKAGANGLFVPGIVDSQVCVAVSEQCLLPVNIMLGDAGSLHHDQLAAYAAMGIQRLSLGPAPFLACYQALSNQFVSLMASRSFVGEGKAQQVGEPLEYAAMNALFGR